MVNMKYAMVERVISWKATKANPDAPIGIPQYIIIFIIRKRDRAYRANRATGGKG